MAQTNGRVYTLGTILILLCIFVIPCVNAYNDCLVDRTRAYQDPTEPALTNYINARMDETKSSISSIFWVQGVSDYSYSSTDQDFIGHINGLSSSTNIVAVQSHGGTSGSSSHLTFGDSSYLSASDVDSWLDAGGYFIFAGACNSAKYSDPGDNFVDKGFNAYLGYSDSVQTIFNSGFCSEFFGRAKYLDVPISSAAEYALERVENELGSQGGTENYEIIGDTDLCLAPSDW